MDIHIPIVFSNIAQHIYTQTMTKQEIIVTNDICTEIDARFSNKEHDKVLVVTDSNTVSCVSLLSGCKLISLAEIVTVEQGDDYKTIETASVIWQKLVGMNATRRSLVINLGGGMITDLGGFVAATFKRGIDCINIPTSLLAMVDAAVGGKTGVNFCGLKNEIGAFHKAKAVFVDNRFLSTLKDEDILSGYAEMIKHSLIYDVSHWIEIVKYNPLECDDGELLKLIETSIRVKENIVDKDPKEKGLRKALNFAHTTAHALESLAMSRKQPVMHGYAVAWGIVCELYMSCVKCGFPTDKMRQTLNYIKQCYGTYVITCKDYDKIYEYMMHDKKNIGNGVNFTLLEDVGRVKLDNIASKSDIFDMLDFFRENMNG